MKDDPLKAPLTPEEQEFAAENHYLIGKYLTIRKLSFEDWYDVVVFRYLRSVKRWFAIPKLHKHNFEIVAFYAMRSAIGHEQERQNRQIKTVSLDEVIPGTDNMTYGETVTYENLLYVNFKGGEDMNIKYNVKLPERKIFKGAAKSDEVIALESFLVGNMKNMCFEYDDAAEAKKRLGSVQSYRRSKGHKELYDVYRNENCVYIVRLAAAK